jgi:hypothetical protein
MSQEPQLTRSVDDPDVPRSLGSHVKRVLAVPGRLLGALFLPDGGMPHVVGRERGGAALLTIVVCAAIAAAVLAVRVDTTQVVLTAETMRIQQAGAQQAEARSDRELQEEIDKSRSMAQVKMGLTALGWTPLKVLLLTLAFAAVGRYVGGKPTMRRTFAATAHASLPLAVKSLCVAALAWPKARLTPMDIEALWGFSQIPLLAGPLARFATLDVFGVWMVVLAGFGLAAAAQITRKRAFITVGILYILVLLISSASAGGGPPGVHGPMPPRG